MRNFHREIIFLLIIAVVVFGSFWCCSQFYSRAPKLEAHAWLHRQLNLTPEQDKKLAAIEEPFHERTQAIEANIKTANQELAQILSEDQRYSDRVARAVENVHHAQGELQKATIDHFFEMRAILTTEQAAKLNKLAVDALTTSP